MAGRIMNLYNQLLKADKPIRLYEQFVSREPTKLHSLLENNLPNMKLHSGQMGEEYPLSPSQREAINHFNHMQEGEVLAVNGPPGTGKTTLLQSVVADLYVQRALKQEKAPLIVAASTNNQVVTNIITSFYGKQEGCYFIDTNKSLMNVAVSRAKDHFFVFGDIQCLKDTTSSASGFTKGKHNRDPKVNIDYHGNISTGNKSRNAVQQVGGVTHYYFA